MKMMLIGTSAALISVAAYAARPPVPSVQVANTPLPVTVQGQPVKVTGSAMNLGTEFKTLSLACGTLGTAGCPYWDEPSGGAYLLHSVSLMVKADGNCSAWASLRFNPPGGPPVDFNLLTVGVNAHGFLANGGGQEGRHLRH